MICVNRLPQEYFIQLRNLLPKAHIIAIYGLTEIGPVTRFNINNQRDRELSLTKNSSIGRPIRGMSYKVIDIKTGKTLGMNKLGELRVKSKSIMNGYYKRDSSFAFDTDGWLKTGDIVYFDEDFCFYFTDRIKDLLIYRDQQISPASIENIILAHPAVKDAIVLGTHHEDDGDLPTALVVLNDDVNISSDDILKYVHQHVDDSKKLRGGVKIVEKIYYTPTKKIKRNYMKQMYLSCN